MNENLKTARRESLFFCYGRLIIVTPMFFFVLYLVFCRENLSLFATIFLVAIMTGVEWLMLYYCSLHYLYNDKCLIVKRSFPLVDIRYNITDIAFVEELQSSRDGNFLGIHLKNGERKSYLATSVTKDGLSRLVREVNKVIVQNEKIPENRNYKALEGLNMHPKRYGYITILAIVLYIALFVFITCRTHDYNSIAYGVLALFLVPVFIGMSYWYRSFVVTVAGEKMLIADKDGETPEKICLGEIKTIRLYRVIDRMVVYIFLTDGRAMRKPLGSIAFSDNYLEAKRIIDEFNGVRE